MKNTVFCDITPCSLVELHHRLGGTYWVKERQYPARSGWQAEWFSAENGADKTKKENQFEQRDSFETSVNFNRNTLRYIAVDSSLYSHRYGNVKSSIFHPCLLSEFSLTQIMFQPPKQVQLYVWKPPGLSHVNGLSTWPKMAALCMHLSLSLSHTPWTTIIVQLNVNVNFPVGVLGKYYNCKFDLTWRKFVHFRRCLVVHV